MTDPFDYTDLFKGAFSAMREEQPGNRIAPAAAYLRTRIEAAFVPRAEYDKLGMSSLASVSDLGTQLGQTQARAEAAEARVKVLEDDLQRIRDRKWNTMTQGCDAAAEAASIARAALGGEHDK